VKDAWGEVALPILRWIAQHEGGDPVSIGTLAEDLDREPMAIANELDRLSDGAFIEGAVRKTMSGGDPTSWHLYPLQLRERGARAVGMWPSGDAGDVLLRALREAEETESDLDRKGRLASALEALGGLTKSVVTELAVSVVKGAAGLP
jgi:hypothetical protein